MRHRFAGSVSPVRSPSPIPKSLTAQLIAYIGNKRRLLAFLDPILCGLTTSTAPELLDPFCGSGAVARLARFRGFSVLANDWEPYAHVATAAYLENSETDMGRLFPHSGGISAVIDALNARGHEHRSDDHGGYVARHYAPESTDNPRLGRERLFYTAENAWFVDSVRDHIDELYPQGEGEEQDRARRLLLSLLLYEASNHANTSGVFKAYHRGFGGYGKDALPRILAPMHLEHPLLPEGPRGSAACLDATEFATHNSGEVAYLDPPYSTHQYGSNYFMLNTIVRWDKPEVDNTLTWDGVLSKKAGIRPDWVATRSKYCSRATASGELADLMDHLDVRHIVLSYSSDGLISLDELTDLLSQRGEVSLRAHDYVVYRGGKQSIHRQIANREVAFVVTSRGRSAAGGSSTNDVRRAIVEHQLSAAVAQRFCPDRLRSEFTVESGGIWLPGGPLILTDDLYELSSLPEVSDMGLPEMRDAIDRLRRAACVDRREEIDIAVSLAKAAWESGAAENVSTAYLKRAVWCLRKFAHRKYQAEFDAALSALRRVVVDGPESFGAIVPELSELERIAVARFERVRTIQSG